MPAKESNAVEKFLYLLLRQSDMKSINWDKVAEELGTTKAAANTRWVRYRQKAAGASDEGGTATSPAGPTAAIAPENEKPSTKCTPKRKRAPKAKTGEPVKEDGSGGCGGGGGGGSGDNIDISNGSNEDSPKQAAKKPRQKKEKKESIDEGGEKKADTEETK
ncbi:hypothetical protein DFH27DRAFT_611231 [Peziza echinospora]|nr:hypothetical protein DFH27DRAFT_611231 [Peziza echinospora]